MTGPQVTPTRALFRIGAYSIGVVIGSALVGIYAFRIDQNQPPRVCDVRDREETLDHRVIYNGVSPNGNRCFVVEVLP